MNERFKEFIVDLMTKSIQIVFGMLVVGPFVTGNIDSGKLIVGIFSCILFLVMAMKFSLLIKDKE